MRVNCLWMLLCVSAPCFADDGYIFGKNHCFHFSTPTGWVANNQLGAKDNIPFVFYPVGGSWARSPTVIYARVAGKDAEVTSIEDKVKDTIRDFHDNGSPGLKAERVGSVTTATGDVGALYRYTGDQWGNIELVAYFEGPHTINFFVMTSRDALDFEKHMTALGVLAASYRPSTVCKPCEAKDAPPATASDASRSAEARCSRG